uniref:Uncharacterized protein n=1 Tax=viral metagenome TaxID=1070528 RepID=A0A6C0L028_9ZZZZ
MNQCSFHTCKHKRVKKYNTFCKMHRREYLIRDGKIDPLAYTGDIKDYLKKDIIQSLSKPHKGKKEDLFRSFDEEIKILNKYKDDIENIIKVQNMIKKRPKPHDHLRGEGYVNKQLCNNDVDFYTFETIDDIEDKYFFSYQDNNGFIWFFDIRSFNKLVEMKQTNPYTREIIPQDIIDKAFKLSKEIQIQNVNTIDTNNLTRKQIVRQKIVDLFSQIEHYGYSCQVEWFTTLGTSRLKSLYRNLEDIWNYRLQLTNETKRRIAPPNGLVFNIPINEIMLVNNRVELQDILVNEIMKFNHAVSSDDKKLGYMYFIIGLSQVSRPCLESHDWLMFV